MKRTTPVTRHTFTNKPLPHATNVLTDERYKELVQEWAENPMKLSAETRCKAIGTLTDRILAGEIVVLPAENVVESAGQTK